MQLLVLGADLVGDPVGRLQVVLGLVDLPGPGPLAGGADQDLAHVLAVAEPGQHLPGLTERRHGLLGVAAAAPQLGPGDQGLADPPALAQLPEPGQGLVDLALGRAGLAEVDRKGAGQQVGHGGHPGVGVAVVGDQAVERDQVVVAEHGHQGGQDDEDRVGATWLVRGQGVDQGHRLGAQLQGRGPGRHRRRWWSGTGRPRPGPGPRSLPRRAGPAPWPTSPAPRPGRWSGTSTSRGRRPAAGPVAASPLSMAQRRAACRLSRSAASRAIQRSWSRRRSSGSAASASSRK